jgi:hypothetical protein
MPGLDVSHLSEGGVTAHGKAAGGGGGRPAVPKVGRGSGILDANGVSHFVVFLLSTILPEDYYNFLSDISRQRNYR